MESIKDHTEKWLGAANKTIVDLFVEQAASIPDEIAIVFEDQVLSYADLDYRSDQLANYLQKLGVKKETLVPICIANPMEMVIGIVAILKAGGAYVPVDPEFPADRIKYMIKDTAAQVVLSDSLSTHFLSAAAGTTVILTDQQKDEISSMPSDIEITAINPDNLVYVIYTSGSTGNPKGVLLEHHNLVDYVGGLYRHIPLSSCHSYALGTSMATDQGNTSLYCSLLLGGTLHLFSKEKFNDLHYIHHYFKSHTIDFLKLVPSHWKSLSLEGIDLLPKKVMMLGGEALHTTVINDFLHSTAQAYTLVNHYGPTETTIGSLLHVINPANTYHHTLPIGKPFSNEKVYLLDADLKEVKDGETGEIYISGSGVARGYLNRKDLTDERFVKDIFSDQENIRMYRTGDLARKVFDGNIQYLGRIDDQVKIRGYRIELGEIESILQKAPGVKQGVVLAAENSFGDKRLIGYVICPEDYNKQAITTFLESKLPAYMVPHLMMRLDTFPFLPNGKVNKKLLPDPDASSLLTNAYYAPNYETETQITAIWKEILDVKRVGIEDNFFELGGNSLLSQKFVALLKTRCQLILPVTKLYQFPTIKDLAAFLDGRKINKVPKKIKRAESSQNTDIAIIGMSGRFPGANSIEELWNILKDGKETTRFFTDDELDPGIPSTTRNNPDYVKARGIVEDVKAFDASFFGITPKLADVMDPQQRIFLEIAWEAIEKTGYAATKYEGTIGVFAGVSHNTYYENNVLLHPELIDNIGKTQLVTVTAKDYISSRTAYALNLKGPAVTVQSACSTSLLAVAQAVQSIRAGQCDMALAGGATINSPVKAGHLYEEGAMMSYDGHCRPFDAAAKGTVFSDGAGVVLLKNKEEAIKDGDFIFAVIKGVGVNSDGGNKGSFTAPSADGQAAAIRMAIDDAAVDPADISYIETHGTATPLGDPIEIEGLNIAFGHQPKNQYCAIGSIKSNFGHLTCASGIAGLIKATLSLHHRLIPASLNFKSPNPNIDFEHSPFIVNSSLKEWTATKTRIAGVSSFGVGGTNVHVVMEEYENPIPVTSASRPVQLVTWSAKNEKSLDSFNERLIADLNSRDQTEFADAAYTLNQFRPNFNYRRFAIAADQTELADKLKDPSKVYSQQKKDIREVVFMFPGQGSQFLNMGKELYTSEPVFRKAMEECNELLKAHLQEDLLAIIYPEQFSTAAEEKLKNTRYSQPALFTISYSLAKLWMSWGIYPSAFIGHSIGEFVAAYFTGILNLQDALKIIAIRGQLMGELPSGSMLSVRIKAEDLLPFLPADVSIAAINSPLLCVVAGTLEAIESFSKVLDQKGLANRLLPTSHAFHSYMMDSVVAPFKNALTGISLNIPSTPIYSTVTGEKLKDEEATNIDYWANHLRATVQFEKAARNLLAENQEKAFLEIGPGNAAATFIRQQKAGKNSVVLTSLEKPANNESAYYTILKAAGQLWLNGLEIDWTAFYQGEQRKMRNDLPTYAFNKTEHWVYPPIITTTNTIPSNTHLNHQPQQIVQVMRKQVLINQIKDILENTSGIDMQDVSPSLSFIEMGLDSLLLTQISIALKRNFNAPITFRQLNEEYNNLDQLATYFDAQLPPETVQQPQAQPATPALQEQQQPVIHQSYAPAYTAEVNGSAIELISQQLQLLARQLALLQGGHLQPSPVPAPIAAQQPVVTKTTLAEVKTPDLTPEELTELKKPFGASPRIEKHSATLNAAQQQYLSAFIARYNEKTKASKNYTQENRPHMADPRVVSGFRPATKELVYSIVINRSKGSRFWDIDGNEYIDALNGFGSNMLGYQPDVIKNALLEQIEKGYEIGPQHELAGEVSKLICEFTEFDRSALCNTGSEAVLGAMRIARTVTARSLIVAFTGSYHGIVDEAIVRGSKKHKTFPAAPGIMPEAVQNMLILDYGTDESLEIIRERAHELAAVLVEPLQSRRPDFLPIEFLKEIRTITENSGTALIFDEVISGFRFHPGGIQGMYGIKADMGTYGKVAGGGISIGIIAGKRKFMDALDGGFWQYGDDSIPEIGVTYFAGTFVRHPLALATAKASLTYLKEQGPQLQAGLNQKTKYIADTINAMLRELKVPMAVGQFGSLWRLKFIEEYPYTELFFALMRLKGIHILEGFPCFLTTSHTTDDIDQMIRIFRESLIELKDAKFIPVYEHPVQEQQPTLKKNIFNTPPVPNAKLGKDKNGNPGWFIQDEKNPGQYLQVN